MAKQSKWNKSFWKKMNHLENLNDLPMLQIMTEELNMVDAIMESNTPVRFGGLLSSKYAYITSTPKGYSGRIGYERTQHINLDPDLPPEKSRLDDETNPEVMESLENVPRRSVQVQMIQNAMENYRYNCQSRIKEWFKSQL